jgi:hypothetical protein
MMIAKLTPPRYAPDEVVTLDPRGAKDTRFPCEVRVLGVRCGAAWRRGGDGRSCADPAVYDVEILATGERFPVAEPELVRVYRGPAR